jgi:hypothetical protein
MTIILHYCIRILNVSKKTVDVACVYGDDDSPYGMAIFALLFFAVHV